MTMMMVMMLTEDVEEEWNVNVWEAASGSESE
jgi:hypothetical protein